jgi:glc operon protein GlcG
MIEMNLAIAEQAARAAQTKARELGTPMTVSVVDEAGRLVYTARGDGAGFFSVNTSRAKAVAAANFKRSTKELGELMAKGQSFWTAVGAAVPGELLPSIGAVPIMANGRLIGAIGCGGGTGEQDHECALAGAEAVKR